MLFAGGVGGARLAVPLAAALHGVAPLTIVVNVGDDFEHLGLAISPDIDTVVYHLSNLADTERGWGIRDETFRAMAVVGELGGPDWFALGDRDLGTHLYRTQRRNDGASLTEITREIARKRGIAESIQILPVSNDPVRTIVRTNAGPLPFQTYLVERRAADTVTGFDYAGAANARPAPDVLARIAGATRLIFAPSNPFVSIKPMLAVPGVADAIRDSRARKIAISPIVGGRAVKGPLVAMLEAFGLPPTALAALEANGLNFDLALIDPSDAAEAPAFRTRGIEPIITPILLRGDAAGVVARTVLGLES